MRKFNIFILFIILLFTASIAETVDSIDLKGYIVNEQEQPVFDYIEIDLNSQKIITGDSKFNFPQLKPGEYYLKINSPASKNHNPLFSSVETRFTITEENGRLSLWNYTPKIVLTKGLTWNFKSVVKNLKNEVLPEISLTLFNTQRNITIKDFSNLQTGNYRVIVNDPFSPVYNKEYDFSETHSKRNMIEMIIGTYNENIVINSYNVWKGYELKSSTVNKNIGSVISLNYPGSPITYLLDYEKISPWIVKTWPIANQTMFSIRDKIKIVFSEDIQFDQNIKSKVLIYNNEKREYRDISLTYDTEKRTLIVTPKENLEKNSHYLLIVSNIKDINNNVMQNDYKISFYTETTDFEDFNHKYLSKNIQNVELKEYIPPTKDGNVSKEILSSLSEESSSTLNKDSNITVKDPQLLISVPMNKSYYSKDIQIKYEVKDIDDYKLVFLLDSEEIATNTKISTEKAHKLTANLYSSDNKLLKSVYREFTIDKSAPQINLSTPLKDINYLKSYEGIVEIIDPNLRDSAIFINDTERGKKISLNENGTYDIVINAVDNANNDVKMNYQVIIDNKVPLISAEINNDDYFTLPFKRKITVLDENLDSKQIILDGQPLNTDVISLKNEGRYELKVTASDKCGNQTEITRIFELYNSINYNARRKIDGYDELFQNFYSKLNTIEKKSGVLIIDRFINAIISENSTHVRSLPDFIELNNIFKGIDLKLNNKILEKNLKKAILLNKYWILPKVSHFISEKYNKIKPWFTGYNYLANKLEEVINVINISEGKILSLYDQNSKTNSPFFFMYFEDYYKNILSIRETAKSSREIKDNLENTLKNLSFGRKIIQIAPEISSQALQNRQLREEINKYFINLLRDIMGNDFSFINTIVKNKDSVNTLKELQRLFIQRKDIKSIESNQVKIITENFFAISITLIFQSKHFVMEFWFERNGNDFKIDHISNLNIIKNQIKLIPIPKEKPKTPEQSETSGLVKIMIILIIFMVISAMTGFFFYKRNQKKKVIANTFIEEDDDDYNYDLTENELDDVVDDNNNIDQNISKDQEDIISDENIQIDKKESKTNKLMENLKKINISKKFNSIKISLLNIFKILKSKMDSLKEKTKSKKVKENNEKVDEEIKKELNIKDLYPENIEDVIKKNTSDFELLCKILREEITPDNGGDDDIIAVAPEKPEITVTNDINDQIDAIMTDDKLENIVDELELSLETSDNSQNDDEDNSSPIDDAINELKINTPKELIEAEKEEIANESLAEELGFKELLPEEELDEYLNLELLTDDDDTQINPSQTTDSETKNVEEEPIKVQKKETIKVEDDDQELLALNDLLDLDDDK